MTSNKLDIGLRIIDKHWVLLARIAAQAADKLLAKRKRA